MGGKRRTSSQRLGGMYSIDSCRIKSFLHGFVYLCSVFVCLFVWDVSYNYQLAN